MAVRIRMKRLGRRHRPYYRICAVDSRRPRDGRVLEELGTYDPMIRETDARAKLNGERIDYWLGVGAQPSDKVKVLIKKYGTDGTHLAQQDDALKRLRPKPRLVAVTQTVHEEQAAEDTTTTAEGTKSSVEESEDQSNGS